MMKNSLCFLLVWLLIPHVDAEDMPMAMRMKMRPRRSARKRFRKHERLQINRPWTNAVDENPRGSRGRQLDDVSAEDLYRTKFVRHRRLMMGFKNIFMMGKGAATKKKVIIAAGVTASVAAATAAAALALGLILRPDDTIAPTANVDPVVPTVSAAPSISSAPSTSKAPSQSPSVSMQPSLSSAPSKMPTGMPSNAPSLSVAPSSMPSRGSRFAPKDDGAGFNFEDNEVDPVNFGSSDEPLMRLAVVAGETTTDPPVTPPTPAPTPSPTPSPTNPPSTLSPTEGEKESSWDF